MIPEGPSYEVQAKNSDTVHKATMTNSGKYFTECGILWPADRLEFSQPRNPDKRRPVGYCKSCFPTP